MPESKVYIILINYNGFLDTIECLESVIKSNYKNFQIILVDNNSLNNSVYIIKKWLEGQYDINKNFLSEELRHLSFPTSTKPLPYIEYNNNEYINSVNTNIQNNDEIIKYPIIFIKSSKNLGFAGGNNLGIKYALNEDDFNYIWLLNNDTVIEKDSLDILLDKFCKLPLNIGIIGSKIKYYSNPKIINSIGGLYNKYLASVKVIGILEEDKGQYDKEMNNIDYISGCSMFIKKEFILDVGLMSEDYFLYFEELDWSERAKLKGWKSFYYFKSTIYHKEGKSIGSTAQGDNRTDFSDYYQLRARLLFSLKYHARYLPIIYLSFIVILFNRLKRKKYTQLYNAIKLLTNPKSNKHVSKDK